MGRQACAGLVRTVPFACRHGPRVLPLLSDAIAWEKDGETFAMPSAARRVGPQAAPSVRNVGREARGARWELTLRIVRCS